MTKREAFAVVMTMLGETYGRPLTDVMMDGYWLVLEDLEEGELRRAARAHMAASKFMPTPAELLAHVRPRVNPGVAALTAWQVVRKAIDVHDWNVGSIDFGPLVNAVVRNLGGWDTLCRATLPELDNPGWLRKRFEEVYGMLSQANQDALHGEPLEGKLPPLCQGAPRVVVPMDGGGPPRKRLEANGVSDARASIAAHIKKLADDKGNGNQGGAS